jgi:hypothetical protein
MFIPISEQVFVPVHRIERISGFGDTVNVKYVDDRNIEKVQGEDAVRLIAFIRKVNARASETRTETPKKEYRP